MKGYLEELVVELQQVGSVHILHFRFCFFLFFNDNRGSFRFVTEFFSKQLHCWRRLLILPNLFLKNPTNNLSEKLDETMK